MAKAALLVHAQRMSSLFVSDKELVLCQVRTGKSAVCVCVWCAPAVCMCVWPTAREWGQKAQAKAHLEHAAHVCDAGGVKAQRLVESIRILPSPKGGIRQGDDACGTRRCGTEGRANQQRTRRACVAQLGSVGRRRRRKRTLNMLLMSVTLEVSNFSGWLKALACCRVQRAGHPTEGNAWHAKMWVEGWANNQQRTWCACVPAREWGQKVQAEAHIEHAVHSCDVGGVKAQRLVESSRILPSPKGGIRQRERVWHGDVAQQKEGRISSARGVRVAQLGSVGRRRRRKRTKNIKLMSVTLEVSKLSGWLKAYAHCRVQRGHPMEGNVWHGDVAQREGRISSMGVWPSSGVWAEGAGGSAH